MIASGQWPTKRANNLELEEKSEENSPTDCMATVIYITPLLLSSHSSAKNSG